MDPNTALENIRSAMRLIIARSDEGAETVSIHLAMALAESAEALDEWLSGAGCLPAAWADAYVDDRR